MGAIARPAPRPIACAVTGAAAAYARIRFARIPFEKKRGGLIGMGMTEKQGGSDVRANTTRAVRSSDGSYRIHRAQMVFLRAAMRRSPGAGAKRRRFVVFLHAAAPA